MQLTDLLFFEYQSLFSWCFIPFFIRSVLETLYQLMAQRVARHSCLRHYRAFMSENDFSPDDVVRLRWVVTSPLVELVVWLSAAKGLWTREW